MAVHGEHFAYFPPCPTLKGWRSIAQPIGHAGRRRRSSPSEHVADSKPGFLPIWGGEQGLERGVGAARRFQVASSMGYGAGSSFRDFLSPCGSKLSRSGSSSLVAKPSCEPPSRYAA